MGIIDFRYDKRNSKHDDMVCVRGMWIPKTPNKKKLNKNKISSKPKVILIKK